MTRGWDSTRYGVFQRLCVRVNLTLCSYPTQASWLKSRKLTAGRFR